MKYAAFTLFFFSLFVLLQNTSCKFGNKFPKETQMLDSTQILVIKSDSAVKLLDSSKIAGGGGKGQRQYRRGTAPRAHATAHGAAHPLGGI